MRSKNGLAAIVLAVLVLAVALLPEARADQEQAMTYVKAGKYLEAAGEFQALVDEHPDYAFAYFMLGNCLLKTDEVGDAEKNLLKAIELNGEDFRYHYQLANTYAKMGKRQEVVGTLNNAEALVADNPQSKQALLKLRGQASYSMKDWQAAIDDLSQVEQDADTSMRLAKASFQIGDPKAPQRLADAAKANPEDASIRELQAEALLNLAATAKSDTDKKERYAEALAASNEYLLLKPGSFEGHYLVGRSALGAKRYDKAATAFTAALHQKPDQCNAMVNLGKALMAKKDWANSFGWFDNATRCDPNMAIAWENKAYTLQKQGKFEEAIQNYEKALSINPSSSFAADNLEFCRQKIRQFDELPDTLG